MSLTNTTTIYGSIVDRDARESPQSKKDKIYGLAFPIGSTPKGGYFAKSSGINLVKGNLRQLLMTERGERVMLPNYGANLRKFLFQPLDEITFEAIKNEIVSSIARYSRGITVMQLRVTTIEENSIYIRLVVRIESLENALTEVEVTL